MTWTAEERETTITTDDASGVVFIWTAQRSVIAQLNRRPAFTLINSGVSQGQPWARYEIPASDWTPWAGAKRKLTEAQKERRLQNLRGGKYLASRGRSKAPRG